MLKHTLKELLNKSMIKLINYSYNIFKMLKENNKNLIHHLKKFLNFSKSHNNHKTLSAPKLDNKQEIDF